MYYEPNDTFLMHYGVKGMKWGVRKSRKEAERSIGTFTASNGQKVAPAKNSYVRFMRNRVAKGNTDRMVKSYRKMTTGRYMDTTTNRLEAAKGERQIRREAQALREYNAHVKDVRKGTNGKYLAKAQRKTALDNAYEKVKTGTTKRQAAFYNDATRKKAAKYVVDKNMTVKQASKKANREAIRNSLLIIGAYGALTYAQMKRMK